MQSVAERGRQVGAAEVGGEAQGRSAKKSQQGAVSKDSLRNAKGKCRKASARLSAERQPTTHPNTLGGYDHVRIFEKV